MSNTKGCYTIDTQCGEGHAISQKVDVCLRVSWYTDTLNHIQLLVVLELASRPTLLHHSLTISSSLNFSIRGFMLHLKVGAKLDVNIYLFYELIW